MVWQLLGYSSFGVFYFQVFMQVCRVILTDWTSIIKLPCSILYSLFLTRRKREAEVKLTMEADSNSLLNHGALDPTEAFESLLHLFFFFFPNSRC